MIITKKALPRRTVLRGLGGVAVALPYLDAMVPALGAAPVLPRRLGYFYFGNGVNVRDWMPKGDERTFEYGPSMKALEPIRDRSLVITGLYNRAGAASGDGGGVHTRSMAAWLSGVNAEPTETSPHLGKTADQHAAAVLGQHTPLPSLEMGLEDTKGSRLCDHGYTCVYKSLSWRGVTAPNPCELSPRQIFERLFGDGGTPDQRRAQIMRRRSILDGVMDDMRSLERQLGPSDRAKLRDQFDDVRVIEERIQKAEAQAGEMPVPMGRPVSVPESYKEYSDLMHDLLASAYQMDISRVATFVVTLESSSMVFRDIGIVETSHTISHHGQKEENLEKYTKYINFLLSNFTRFVQKLQAMPEGDGTVLDRSLLLFGGGMSDGDSHDASNLPIVLAGGAPLKTGRVVVFPNNKRVPLSNLMATTLELSGVPIDRLGDSDGRVKELSQPLSL